jgi:hypothetical protein
LLASDCFRFRAWGQLRLNDATGHNKACKNSPLNVPRLKRRLKGVNTAVAEQVFSWFRGYARVFNEMRALRHKFLVLYYCRLHNQLVDVKNTSHLNAYSANKSRIKKTGTYACSKKAKPTIVKAKAMRAKTKIKTKTKPTIMKAKAMKAAAKAAIRAKRA